MNNANRKEAPRAPASHHRGYPLHKVVAAMEPGQVEDVVRALGDAGFDDDAIEIVTTEDMSNWSEPVGGRGVRGILTRLGLSAGGDYDTLEQARQELAFGHSIIMVMVDGGEEQDRVHAILREHGGHAMSFFGRWTITTLAREAHQDPGA